MILYGSPPERASADSDSGVPAGGRDARLLGAGLVSSTGLPGVIIPAGYTKANLPVGIQFIGKSFYGLRLLQVANGYEQASRKRKAPQITTPLPGEKFDY